MNWRRFNTRIEPTVDPSRVQAFGFSRVTWWLHTHKANIIFIIMLIAIIAITIHIEESIRQEQCAADQTIFSAWMGVDIVLMIAAYWLIWPHTQFRSLPKDSSQFLGHTAIARQQRTESLQTLTETSMRYQPRPSFSTPMPEPIQRPPRPSFSSPMPEPIQRPSFSTPIQEPIVGTIITPIEPPQPTQKNESSWLPTFDWAVFN